MNLKTKLAHRPLEKKYLQNYRCQVEALQLFTSLFLEVVHKAAMTDQQLLKIIRAFGDYRACVLGRGKENKNLYFSLAAHCDEIKEIFRKKTAN